MNITHKNVILLLLVLALILTPFIVQQGADFAGADGKAQEIIGEVQPGYQPWFSSLWEPPSGEVESFLFAVQAALGSGFVCYYLGYLKGKAVSEKRQG
ncbi:MAG: energy-coupling factor ABC transporter substrate-binding protein [Thermoanaerobacteraceae bacterium]|nr:energy-coupling factor ABC transporter substrate-binding protein [Thermoanaerobacteraceae bacterium]